MVSFHPWGGYVRGGWLTSHGPKRCGVGKNASYRESVRSFSNPKRQYEEFFCRHFFQREKHIYIYIHISIKFLGNFVGELFLYLVFFSLPQAISDKHICVQSEI